MVALHREAGHELLLVAATPEDQDELDALLRALNSDVIVIRLAARSETGVGRILAREPADWSGLAQLVDTARNLGPQLENLHERATSCL